MSLLLLLFYPDDHFSVELWPSSTDITQTVRHREKVCSSRKLCLIEIYTMDVLHCFDPDGLACKQIADP